MPKMLNVKDGPQWLDNLHKQTTEAGSGTNGAGKNYSNDGLHEAHLLPNDMVNFLEKI